MSSAEIRPSNLRELLSAETVAEHNTAESCWVTLYNRKVYDVTAFLKDHPNVDNLLIKYAGQDVTELLKHPDHKNYLGESCYNELEDNKYLVGYLATNLEKSELLSNKNHKVEVELHGEDEWDSTTFVKELPTEDKLSIATNYKDDYEKHKFLDLNKPLLPQVMFGGFTRDFYIDQVHRPRHYGKGSAPLFGNFLEPISLTAWWVVPTIWLPVSFYSFGMGVTHMNPIGSIFLFFVGMFVWSFLEYIVHRFLFHMDDHLPDNAFFITLHFLMHGVHHYLPMDPYRLVMPPAMFITLCAPVYKILFSVFPLYWAYSGFGGGIFGYVCYDMIHYWVHHSKMPPFMRKLKQYHLEHHYKNYSLGFGVSSWFWDKVFGTYLDKNSPLAKMKYA